MSDEKNEAQILSPEIEVAGFKVRPWTFKQFFEMLPIFASASLTLKNKGIAFKDFETMASDPEKFLEMFSDLGSIIPEVVARTIGLSAKEIEEIEFDRVISIALVILIQNAERIKNFSGLGRKAMNSLAIN